MYDDDDEITLDPPAEGEELHSDTLELELWAQARLEESAARYILLETLLDRFRAETGAPRPSGVAALSALEDAYIISYDHRARPRIHARLTTHSTGD
jgi:hypothetical protein